MDIILEEDLWRDTTISLLGTDLKIVMNFFKGTLIGNIVTRGTYVIIVGIGLKSWQEMNTIKNMDLGSTKDIQH